MQINLNYVQYTLALLVIRRTPLFLSLSFTRFIFIFITSFDRMEQKKYASKTKMIQPKVSTQKF